MIALLHESVRNRVEDLRLEFVSSLPFRHVVMEPFLDAEFCAELMANFPPFHSGHSINERGEAGRKAIVIVTDAQDEGSKVKLEEAIESAQRTDTVIHVLLVADSRYGGNGGVARRLADDTGGRVIFVSSEKKLEEAFDQISEELRSQYTLGYYPTNNSRDGRFRKIKLDVDNHDLKVLARKGYYAPKG